MSQPPKLLDRVRERLRVKHYAWSTEKTYVQWVERFILFHNKRHPREMGAPEVQAFLAYLAVEEHVSASTQNQAFSAILFLYREVLQQELSGIEGQAIWAKKPKRLPPVLAQSEVRRVLLNWESYSILIPKGAQRPEPAVAAPVQVCDLLSTDSPGDR